LILIGASDIASWYSFNFLAKECRVESERFTYSVFATFFASKKFSNDYS
jgi:hypothetical protein